MTAPVSVRPLDATTYQRHPLHVEDRAWPETNCYVDLWIELLHGFGLDPMPALGFTLGLDYEGDQYTFYKFSHSDITDLYGIEVQELNVWKPLLEHAIEQVAMGRVFIPEVDSFWLPDTAGVSHRIEHTKSSIAIQHVDAARRLLGYFHGASYYELSGDDFDGVFRLNEGQTGPNILPPFAEIAKLDGLRARPVTELVTGADHIIRRTIARRPAVNPIAKHRDQFPADLAWLRASTNPALFHQYAFATFRQLGSCFGVAASVLEWMTQHGETSLDTAAAGCDAISKTAKAMQFKLARAVTLKRETEFTSSFDSMASNWDAVMSALASRYGA